MTATAGVIGTSDGDLDMLQLPTQKSPSTIPTIKRGAMKGFPDTKPFNCKVMALAAEYEKLVTELDAADDNGTDTPETTGAIFAKMERIARKASWLSPQSFEGAVFQIMLATLLPAVIANGTTPKIRKDGAAQFKRLIYRSFDRLDTNGYGTLPLTRRELLPPSLDPGADSRRAR